MKIIILVMFHFTFFSTCDASDSCFVQQQQQQPISADSSLRQSHAVIKWKVLRFFVFST